MRASTKVTNICAVALCSLTVAACGSSSSSGHPNTAATASGAASTGGSSTTASTSSSGPTAAGGATTSLALINVPGYGKVLGTSAGKALYMLTADSKNTSKCDTACTSVWPPLTASGKPSAGSGVSASMVSVFKRTDGKEQVSYNGHPLYTYTGPTAASGEGLASYGGVWYLIDAGGKAVKKTLGNGSY